MAKQGKGSGAYKIQSVKTVSGRSLNKNWKSPMQEVKTDKGTFIDNQPGKQFGSFGVGSPGHSWQKEVGKTVLDVKTITQDGLSWLNKKK